MVNRATPVLKPVFPKPALLVQNRDEKVLVVADLHIGWETALYESGIYIPSQTRKLLRKLVNVLKRCKPSVLIFLGDVKHGVAKLENVEWRNVPEFLETVRGMVEKVIIVPGNHDGDIEALTPDGIDIAKPSGLTLWGEVGLFHGHSWPKPELFKCRTLVMGHIHPAVTFRDRFSSRFVRGVWVKANVNSNCLKKYLETRVKKADLEVYSERLIIMPSFNSFMRGKALNEEKPGVKAISPILRSKCIDMESCELYLLDGVYIGSLEDVREVTRVLI